MKKVETLCIIDDDEIFNYLTQRIVNKTDLVDSIMVFYNGLEAIQFFQSAAEIRGELPDVILLDLRMPVLDGWGFLEEYVTLVPKLGKKITIYIVSSSIDPSDIERARTIEVVSDFIIKPLTQEKFTKMVQQIA